MSDVEVKSRLREVEDSLRLKYSKLSKVLLILGFLLFIWGLVIFIGARIVNLGYNWALLPVNYWIIIITFLIGLFVLLILGFFLHFNSVRNKRIKSEIPEVEYIEGRKVYVFTHPQGIEGGIFSKTYIEIDDKNILRLRNLIVSSEELWKKNK